MRVRTPKIYEARDVEAMLAGFADDAVFEFGGSSAMAGRYQGKDEIRAWFTAWWSRMTELRFTVRRVGVTRPWALGLSNTVFVEWTVDETSRDGVTVHAEGVGVLDFRRGKIVRARDYLFDERPELTMWGAKADVAAHVPRSG